LLAATYHLPEKKLYIAQQGGLLQLDKRSANGLFKQTDLALADASIAHFLHAAAADERVGEYN
jgi:hypothetical protein